ncbi:basic amino acid/polyamine antiporter [Pseudaeromonas sharmana]|uniref:Basic amino acid/polyamine antiporter n=1 Tax=Pseudaeromonas sharmana TaxID=328412 RepID=A0ABV8CNN4_9GAMM
MSNQKIGVWSLTALVFSSMVGAGVFSLPQNMAQVAAPLAVLIGWAITGVGIILLALCFLHLSRQRPDLEGGIYTYARAGFGELVGFCSAWGYWLCATIGIVSYLVIVFATLSLFTDGPEARIFGDGNTWQAVSCGSLFVWAVHWLVARGIREAALVNLLATVAKLVPLLLFIGLALLAFRLDLAQLDFHGLTLEVPVWEQVKQTMIITLWVFTGIEGAVVLSARAQKRRDIGRATLFGVLLALVIYVLVTLLSFGLQSRETLAGLHNPSMALLMGQLLGEPGKVIIAIGLVISVCASYLSWTLFAVEVPWSAANHGAFPAIFRRQNQRGVAINSLWLTSLTVQASLLAVLWSGEGYNTLLAISSQMILVPYLLVGAFLLKWSWQQTASASGSVSVVQYLIAAGATLYGAWLLYASGLDNLLLSLWLYIPGLLLFWLAKRRSQSKVLNTVTAR